MKSVAFSSFRHLMDVWDESLLTEEESAIQSLANHPGLMLFFKKGDGLFAGPEESRVTFAKLKSNDDEEITDDWKDEANFVALDLLKALKGEKSHNVFANNDMPEIEIMIDKDSICDILNKHAKTMPDPISGIKKFLSSIDEE